MYNEYDNPGIEPGQTMSFSQDITLRLFISYTRRDNDILEVLEPRLNQLGEIPGREVKLTEIWYDKRNIPVGQKWCSEIIRGIQNADVLTAFISTDSMQSEYVRHEITTARRMGKSILPIRLHRVDTTQLSAKAAARYRRFSRTQQLNLSDVPWPNTEHPRLEEMDGLICRAWVQKLSSLRSKLATFDDEKRFITDLSQFHHPWIVHYFDHNTRDLMRQYLPDRAQYYVDALIKMPDLLTKDTIEALKQWWRAEFPVDLTILLEQAIKRKGKSQPQT
jgi:hypothetical protein